VNVTRKPIQRCGDYGPSDIQVQQLRNMLENNRYFIAFSSGPEVLCEYIKFFSGGTFFYSFMTRSAVQSVNYTGQWSADDINSAPVINLAGLPPTVLGANLDGVVQMSINGAGNSSLHGSVCVKLGFISLEQVYGLIKEEDLNAGTREQLKQEIDDFKYLYNGQISARSDYCGAGQAQSRNDPIVIFDLLVKFGIIPRIPFLREIVIAIIALLTSTGGARRIMYSADGIPRISGPSIEYIQHTPAGSVNPVYGYFIPVSDNAESQVSYQVNQPTSYPYFQPTLSHQGMVPQVVVYGNDAQQLSPNNKYLRAEHGVKQSFLHAPVLPTFNIASPISRSSFSNIHPISPSNELRTSAHPSRTTFRNFKHAQGSFNPFTSSLVYQDLTDSVEKEILSKINE